MRAAALAVALVAVGGCASGERHFLIPSSAMEPTLHCARPAPGCLRAEKDEVVVRPYGHAAPRRGDIVVFDAPMLARERCGASGRFVKRVIGLPGERWSERRGTILIDGRPLRETYLRPERRGRESLPGGRISRARYLLLGDNRSSSCDSRIWGTVPLRSFLGRVVEIRRGPKRIRIG
jgi:signal peptidase I